MDDSIRVARARAVTQTVLSQGWPVIVGIATAVLKVKEAEALECQDDEQVIRLQRKAQAAKEFLTSWMQEVDKAQNPELTTASDEFITIATE
jgi:basic membrane lipoprotein Med (substrate-binding protein (PBP1-ABC) superfamily)